MSSLRIILFTIGFLVGLVSTNQDVHRKFTSREKMEFLREIISGFFLQETNTKSHHAAFAAKLTHHMLNKDRNVVIKFDDVVTNQGNGYNKDNGTFTAPVAGTYLFAWHILCREGKKADVHLFVNGADTWKTYADAPGEFHEPASATVVLQLKKGDAVQLRTYHSSGHFINGNGYSGFTGNLLYIN